jgi:hypothetical protein
MATYRDRDAQAVVDAAREAEALLGQTLPDMVAARPPGVVIPPVPRSVVGPDGTIQTMPPQQVIPPLPRAPVLGDQSGSIMNGGKLRRGY